MHKYWELIGKPRSSDNDPLGSVKTDILVTLSYVNLTDLNKFSNSGVGMSIHLALGDYPTVLSNAKLGRTKCRFASFYSRPTSLWCNSQNKLSRGETILGISMVQSPSECL